MHYQRNKILANSYKNSDCICHSTLMIPREHVKYFFYFPLLFCANIYSWYSIWAVTVCLSTPYCWWSMGKINVYFSGGLMHNTCLLWTIYCFTILERSHTVWNRFQCVGGRGACWVMKLCGRSKSQDQKVISIGRSIFVSLAIFILEDRYQQESDDIFVQSHHNTVTHSVTLHVYHTVNSQHQLK